MSASHLISKYLHSRNTQPKQRLQFPTNTQQRKHYQARQKDKVKLGQHDQFFLNNAKRNNNLDISDIDGAKPKNNHKARSQPRCSTQNPQGHEQFDSLSRMLHKRELSLKHLGVNEQYKPDLNKKRVVGSIVALQIRKQQLTDARELNKHIKTEPTTSNYFQPQFDKYRIVEQQEQRSRMPQKRTILQNPTYLSSLFLG